MELWLKHWVDPFPIKSEMETYLDLVSSYHSTLEIPNLWKEVNYSSWLLKMSVFDPTYNDQIVRLLSSQKYCF